MHAFRQPDLRVRLSDSKAGRLAIYRSDQHPDARPVVYLHGAPANARMWKRYLVRPVEGTHTIAVDRPGYGASDWNSPPISFADHARAIAQVLPPRETPANERPILHGHSFGAPIAAHIAADHPDRIAGLIIAAGLLNPVHRRLTWGGRTGLALGIFSRSFRQAGRELHSAPSQAKRLRTTLVRIRTPTLIVHGTRDRLVPYADVAMMRSALSSASSVQTITLDGAGHFYPWFDEKDARRSIADFVSATAASN